MNRRDLVQAVSTHTGVERKDVDAVLKGFTDVVTAVVAKGEDVAITGFAKFKNVSRPARMGRNPQTQQPVRIKASKKARITPLKGFKDAVMKASTAPKLARGVWPAAPAAKATATKTTAAKKATAAKKTATAAKKATPARKTTARKTTASATARKAPARTTAAKKATAKKAPAKKAPAKKAPARKAVAKKTTTARR